MGRYCELTQKEVINVRDGSLMGNIRDMDMDFCSGQVRTIILQGEGRFFGFFGPACEYVIPWECIRKIGEDIILVDVETAGCRQNINK